jgi:hypothetical protein
MTLPRLEPLMFQPVFSDPSGRAASIPGVATGEREESCRS